MLGTVSDPLKQQIELLQKRAEERPELAPVAQEIVRGTVALIATRAAIDQIFESGPGWVPWAASSRPRTHPWSATTVSDTPLPLKTGGEAPSKEKPPAATQDSG
jgi:hypothetical protein